MKLEEKILLSWQKEYLYEKTPSYPIYPVDDMQIILTTDDKVLRQYRHIPRKGKIKNASDSYELDMLDKVSKEYNIRLNANLYYVMWSN